MPPILIVQGAQYGSEGKGATAAAICSRRRVDFACRTGAVNAGHTVWFQGRNWKMQQFPTGWVVPSAKLVIGPGALIHPDIAAQELQMMQSVYPDINKRIYVDYRAGLHLPVHTERSTASGRHYKMGATGKGCSEALCERISARGSGGLLFRDHECSASFNLCDTSELVNNAYDLGAQILLEGTQGSLLDLYLGPYPYTTHKPTQAATWIQEMGLSPSLQYEVVLVARTMPIRVAGNSGPMPHEIGWPELARSINHARSAHSMRPLVSHEAIEAFEEVCKKVIGSMPCPRSDSGRDEWRLEEWSEFDRCKYQETASELHKRAFQIMDPKQVDELRKLFEMTTVTKKLRRIARWDWEGIAKAVMWNRPAYFVITFMDYIFPEAAGVESITKLRDRTWRSMEQYFGTITRRTGVPVRYATFGPQEEHMLEFPYNPPPTAASSSNIPDII